MAWVLFLLGGSQSGLLGQAIGVEVVVDTAFYATDPPSEIDPTGMMDGFVSYLVYAQFTNPTDVLSAVFTDVAGQPGSGPMFLDAPCGCFNPVITSPAMDATNNSLLWQFPSTALYKYDTFWTIGKLSGDAPGQTPTWLSIPQAEGENICSESYVNAGAFVTGAPVNAVAGDDLRIAVARVTTCGDWSLNLNLQVFIQGDQGDNQLFFLDAEGGSVFVEDPCEDYAEVEATISGNAALCADLAADVDMEFLGLNEDVATTYSVYFSDDDFATEALLQTGGVSQFPGLSQGDYRVEVVDEFGCRDTVTFEVATPPAILMAVELVDDNECFGEGDALVVIPDGGLSGGSGDLAPLAVGPAGDVLSPVSTTDSLYWTGLVCEDGDGTFVFTVTDDNGCTKSDTLFVNCPEPLEATLTSGDVICAGDADGFIVAEATGGSGDLFLTNQFATVGAADGLLDLGPAVYQAWVYDEFNCTSDTSFLTIGEPAPIELSIGDITNPSCGLDCDGEVALTSIGGSGPLESTYFNTTTNQLSLDSVGLCAGEFVATVTDTAGCAKTVVFEVEAPAPLDFLIVASNATCTGMSNGSADVFPIGGTVSDQEYDWVVIDTAGQAANLNNLSEMTYTALVTDQIGCTYAESFDIGIDIVTDMELSALASPVTCWGAADGTATVSVNGGEAPFAFEWSDPFAQSTSTAVGLTEDVYTVVVTDALGCRRTTFQEVEAIEGCLFIADALTPNDDGKNDEWLVGGLEDYPESEVFVYNRWGQRVFSTIGGKESWNGRFNGARLPVADYYYTIELFPSALPIRGTVTLKY